MNLPRVPRFQGSGVRGKGQSGRGGFLGIIYLFKLRLCSCLPNASRLMKSVISEGLAISVRKNNGPSFCFGHLLQGFGGLHVVLQEVLAPGLW